MYMDPQKLASLDPKLREAYQRVMGTPIPKTQTPPPPPKPTADPNQNPTPEPQPEPFPTPQPAIPTPPTQASNFVQMNSEAATPPTSQNFITPSPMPQSQTITVKKKNGMMPILIGIAGLVFVAIYTLFWTKIFNFKLPFLP